MVKKNKKKNKKKKQKPAAQKKSLAENPPRDARADKDVAQDTARAYWKANLQLLGGLLVVWFLVSFGAGILFVDQLNKLSFLGMPLGFWFAQQGSIYVFVILIFVYAGAIHRIERKFGVDDD